MTIDYFNQWYADIDRSPRRHQLFTTGLDLPEEVGPSNLVPLNGLREVAASLSLSPGEVLVDVACGRGGPGMWVARELGVDLIGVDFSATAVAQASARRPLFGLTESATFVVGRLEDTGLPAGGADALMCIDAIQFGAPPAAATAEVSRVLRRGGRVAMTTWEPVEPGDPQLGPRTRDLDVAAALRSAGFTSIRVDERPQWHAAARRLWEATLATDPGDDPALRSMQQEGAQSLATHDRMRRILATAVAP
jgi:SAM-dependent methyltransferase